MGRYGFYYQIDYIDKDGTATYIDAFNTKELNKAIKHVTILNNANYCINSNTVFVLDKYKSISEDEGKLIEENITNAMSIEQKVEEFEKQQKKGI